MKKINEMNAKELFDLVKNSKEDIRVIFKTESGFLKNSFTDNLMDVYHYYNDNSDFYGVYGDLVDNEQKDSRNNTDEEILKGIENLILNGMPELLEVI